MRRWWVPCAAVALVAMFGGTACTNGLALVVLFPDATTEASVRSVELFALDERVGTTCVALQLSPGSARGLATYTESYAHPPAANPQFPQLRFGTWVLFAEALGPSGGVVARGCVETEVDRGTRGEIELLLAATGDRPEAGLDSGSDSTVDSGPPRVCGTAPSLLDFCATTNVPLLNGNIGSGEWGSAGSCTGTLSAGGAVTFYGMANATTLFFGVVADDASEVSTDRVSLVVDTNSNSGDPDSADRVFQVARDGTAPTYVGFGTNMDGFVFTTGPPSVFSSAISTNANGWSAELSIPRSELADPPAGSLIHVGVTLRNDPSDEVVACPVGLLDVDLSTLGYSIIE